MITSPNGEECPCSSTHPVSTSDMELLRGAALIAATMTVGLVAGT